jgi:iron complex transport system ATP-binding protein
MLARAIVAEADILILGEPTSSLDMKNQSLILEWLDSLNKTNKLTIIFTTHLPQHAMTVADEVLLMFGDCKYASGPSMDILSEENLFKLYGVPMRKIKVDYEEKEIVSCVPIFKRR